MQWICPRKKFHAKYIWLGNGEKSNGSSHHCPADIQVNKNCTISINFSLGIGVVFRSSNPLSVLTDNRNPYPLLGFYLSEVGPKWGGVEWNRSLEKKLCVCVPHVQNQGPSLIPVSPPPGGVHASQDQRVRLSTHWAEKEFLQNQQLRKRKQCAQKHVLCSELSSFPLLLLNSQNYYFPFPFDCEDMSGSISFDEIVCNIPQLLY